MEAAIRVLLGPPNDLGRIRDNATDIALGAHSPIEYSRDSLQAAPRSLGEAFLAITQDRNTSVGSLRKSASGRSAIVAIDVAMTVI